MKRVIKHSVWVGGAEVNDVLLDIEKADEIALQYLDDGYPPEDIYIGYYVIMEEE